MPANGIPVSGLVHLITSPPADPSGRASRAGSRVLARVFAPPLDRELAAGRPPQSGRLLAARAGQLTSPAARRSLAHDWEDLVQRSREPVAPRSPRAPLCRDRVAAAESDVRDLRDALISSCRASARGVAAASLLLRDGTGPLFNPHWVGDLRMVLRRLTDGLYDEGLVS